MKSEGKSSWTSVFTSHYLKANNITTRKKQDYAAVHCRHLKFTTSFQKLSFTVWNAFIFRAFIEGVIHLRSAKYLVNHYDELHEFLKDDLEDVHKKTGSSIITKLQLKTFQDWIRTGVIKAPSQGGEHGITTNNRALGKTIKARD
jgi:hypothetical protein